MFISAVLCNIIVCSGVMMAYSAKTVSRENPCAWFPIAVFVLSAQKHIVAKKRPILVMAFVNGANITVAGILISFVVVAIGNFVGGAAIIAGASYYIDKELAA